MRVLVVDDERAVRESLQRSLEFEGYDVALAVDGLEALTAVQRDRPDAVVLDVAMPRLDGLETCRRLRARGDDVPVLMLTAREKVSDRVSGLDAGADDYLVKPFALEELLARLRALVRRVGGTGGGVAGPPLDVADLRIDPSSRTVSRNGRPVRLTKTEFSLLELLARHAGQVLPRTTIMQRVWGYDFGSSSNSLEVFVSYLRRKLEEAGEPRLVHTVRGVGYTLRETPP